MRSPVTETSVRSVVCVDVTGVIVIEGSASSMVADASVTSAFPVIEDSVGFEGILVVEVVDVLGL